MKKILAAMAATASGLFFTGLGAVAYATTQAATITLADPLGGSESFASISANVINFLSGIAIPITIIMVLVGAFQMMTSAGDPEKTTQARKTLQYAAIGFAIAVLASGITDLIINILTGQ